MRSRADLKLLHVVFDIQCRYFSADGQLFVDWRRGARYGLYTDSAGRNNAIYILKRDACHLQRLLTSSTAMLSCVSSPETR